VKRRGDQQTCHAEPKRSIWSPEIEALYLLRPDSSIAISEWHVLSPEHLSSDEWQISWRLKADV
jgi:hypothetical protein